MKIHWGRIVIGGFLTEAVIIAGFLALLFATRLAGAPTIALPSRIPVVFWVTDTASLNFRARSGHFATRLPDT